MDGYRTHAQRARCNVHLRGARPQMLRSRQSRSSKRCFGQRRSIRSHRLLSRACARQKYQECRSNAFEVLPLVGFPRVSNRELRVSTVHQWLWQFVPPISTIASVASEPGLGRHTCASCLQPRESPSGSTRHSFPPSPDRQDIFFWHQVSSEAFVSALSSTGVACH